MCSDTGKISHTHSEVCRGHGRRHIRQGGAEWGKYLVHCCITLLTPRRLLYPSEVLDIRTDRNNDKSGGLHNINNAVYAYNYNVQCTMDTR